MAVEVRMPQLGLTMTEGVVTRWLKSVGEKVAAGEPLLEVETDKINNEVEAPAEGVLLAILVEEGKTAPVQAPLALIGAAGETVAAVPASAAASAPLLPSAPAAPAPMAAESAAEEKRVKASPIARRLAGEAGIDLGRLQGSGPGGRIVERDVVAARSRPPAPAAAPLAGTVVPLSSMRRTIAERMSRAWASVPHITLTVAVDMTEAAALKQRLDGMGGRKISFTEIFVRAAALALGDFPYLNASLASEGMVFHAEVNIGIAVALDDGLIVPVVRNADRKTLSGLGVEIRALAEKARAGLLTADEVSGGTFTVTNLGMYGVDSFTPIVNAPESAILGVCRIEERQVVRDGAPALRRMTTLCLSCDHRLIDGALAARFLARVKALLEDPALMV